MIAALHLVAGPRPRPSAPALLYSVSHACSVPTGIGDERGKGAAVATRKDQLDAFNFARRRMVANLVAPTATGSDEGAPRPVKTFATSIILSAIAVAAVAVLGVFKPAAPSGWQNGLAVDESTGAAYIYSKSNNQLHSVYNITSARLILGGNFAKYDVPDSTINDSGITIGAPVGILGAPEDVPSASDMTLTQWSLCQNEANPENQTQPGGATYLEIGYGPSTQTPVWTSASEQGIIVHDSQGNVFLVTGDYRYEVGNYNQESPAVINNLLTGLASDQYWAEGDYGYWVSDAWLSAFTLGHPITFPTLAGGVGGAAPANQIGKQVGDYGANQSGGHSVQTQDGVLQLDPFAYYLYAANMALAHTVSPINSSSLTAAAIESANNAHGSPTPDAEFTSGTYGDNWPQTQLNITGSVDDTTDASTQDLCVGYDGKYVYENGSSVPQLTTWLYFALPYGSPGGQFGLSQSDSGNLANVVLVRPGYGLIAQRLAGAYGSGGYEYLIEDSDYRYALQTVQTPATSTTAASTESAKVLLGYQYVTDEQVPQAWVNLIQGGATLNPTLAGMTPGSGQ